MDKKYYFWYIGITLGLFFANILIRMNGYKSPILIALEYLAYGVGCLFLVYKITTFLLLEKTNRGNLEDAFSTSLFILLISYTFITIYQKTNPYSYPGLNTKILYLLIINIIIVLILNVKRLLTYIIKIASRSVILKRILNKVLKRSENRIKKINKRSKENLKHIFNRILDSRIFLDNRYRNLIIAYSIIVLGIFLRESLFTSLKIEFITLFFLIATIIMITEKIESNIFFISAVILLGYCSILFYLKENAIGLSINIYAFFFLFFGFIVSLIEIYWKGYEIKLKAKDLAYVIKMKTFYKLLLYSTIGLMLSFYLENSLILKSTLAYLILLSVTTIIIKYLFQESSPKK